MATWVFNAALGGMDISDDGSFIVVGGTDNRIHILSKDKKVNLEVPFEEYVEEVDISANGKYVAAGTGGSVYFFETISKDAKEVPCTIITEPRPIEEVMRGGSGMGEQVGSSDCSDGSCEGPETRDPLQNIQAKLPGMLLGFGFVLSALLLVIFTALRKLKFFEKQKRAFIQYNVHKLSFLKLTGKKLIIVLLALTALFLFLTGVVAYLNRDSNSVLLKQGGQAKPEPGKVIMNQENKRILNEGEQKSGVCGNSVCEPGLGETKEICPQDCSGEIDNLFIPTL